MRGNDVARYLDDWFRGLRLRNLIMSRRSTFPLGATLSF
jgi:hypothetical protein